MNAAQVEESTEILINKALTSSDWIEAAGILLGSLVLAVVVSRLLRRVLTHGIGPGFAPIIMGRLASYAVFLLGLFYTLSRLGVRVGPLLGALGLGGLVLALALQGLVENFVGSIILQTGRPFSIGDTVELDGQLGVVEDIDARTTVLASFDGTQVRIPNKSVLSATIVNLTHEPVRRSQLVVGVAYDSNLEQAFEALTSVFERVPRVVATPEPLVTLTGFGESSIDFKLLYWHRSDVPAELATHTDLTMAVHQALATANITIAFPQVVVWSGSNKDAPYVEPRPTIATNYPGLDAPPRTSKKWNTPQFRLPGRPKTD